MTPDISAVVEQTIRLQQQTNHLQLLCLILIFVSDIMIVLAVLNIRKTIRINREWTKTNQEWSARLSAASGTLTEGGDAKQAPGESLSGPTAASGDAQEPAQGPTP